jgi:predicted flap endonuclease-1-like 5' DNA nuclease
MLTELLHEIGVFYFWQIAEWSSADVEYVDGKLLHFKGRIERDDWVGQSRQLALLPTSAKRPEAE